MIKQIFAHIKLATISLMLFTACTQDEVFLQNGENPTSISDNFTINSVAVSDFETDGFTRANNDGNIVTFEPEDKLGILLLNADGELIKNAAFNYTEVEGVSNWANTENINYSNKIVKAIAYFPYTEKANSAKSVEDLKGLFDLKVDQSRQEDFKAMDLLIDEIAEVASPTLNIELEHAYSLVSFTAKSVLQVGEESFDYFIELSDVAFAVNGKSYTPCMLGGEYVCLIEPDTKLTPESFRYFYTTDENTYVKTLKTEKTIGQNSRYTFPCEIGTEGVSSVIAGDFYCTTTSGAVAILPGSASTLPSGLTCHGIVFYTMDKSEIETFVANNEIPNVTIGDDDAPHGLVVSLKNGNGLFTSNIGGNNITELTELVSGISHEELQGYLLTQKFSEKYKEDFTALGNHITPVIGSLTGWYGPSIKEMFIMGRGGDGTFTSNVGALLLNKQIQKLGGDRLEGNIPSVSFEANAGFKLLTSGDGTELGWKGFPGEPIRPIFAF